MCEKCRLVFIAAKRGIPGLISGVKPGIPLEKMGLPRRPPRLLRIAASGEAARTSPTRDEGGLFSKRFGTLVDQAAASFRELINFRVAQTKRREARLKVCTPVFGIAKIALQE